MRRRTLSSFVLPILLSGSLVACGGTGSTPEPGTGGSNASSGGSTGSGGKTSTGGSNGSGGETGSGGHVGNGSGGATGSGGSGTSSGGATGSGGAKPGSGGATGSGGTPGTASGGAGGGHATGGTAGAPPGSGGTPAGGANGSGGNMGAGGSGPGAASMEDTGADCTVGTIPGNGTKVALLPDPFKKLDGTEMTMKSEWRCRREEILQTAEKIALGKKPSKPDMVTGTVTSSKITVNVTQGGKTSTFSATVTMPTSGKAPYPAIITYTSAPLDSATINSEGVAMINYNPYDVGAEGNGHSANQKGAFYSVYSGGSGQTGLLAAWAWGVSRIIDVITDSGSSIIDPTAIGVTGCSRFGKGSFIAGVLDQRIALTMPIESGTDGVPVWRGIAKAEKGENGNPPQSMSSAYSEQPWYYDGSMAIDADPTVAPIDTHELVAMIAPRGLFIMENPHIGELASKYGHVAALGAAEVYKALGAGDAITYYSDVQSGTHCSARPEWVTPLKNNIERFLKKTGTAAGVIKAASSQTGDLSTWRDWTTPTLN